MCVWGSKLPLKNLSRVVERFRKYWQNWMAFQLSGKRLQFGPIRIAFPIRLVSFTFSVLPVSTSVCCLSITLGARVEAAPGMVDNQMSQKWRRLFLSYAPLKCFKTFHSTVRHQRPFSKCDPHYWLIFIHWLNIFVPGARFSQKFWKHSLAKIRWRLLLSHRILVNSI